VGKRIKQLEPPDSIYFNAAGLARQNDEDRLGDFLCQMRVAHLSQCHGIDEIDMPGDQLGKGGFPIIQIYVYSELLSEHISKRDRKSVLKTVLAPTTPISRSECQAPEAADRQVDFLWFDSTCWVFTTARFTIENQRFRYILGN
jgi:hypothetical protein